MLDRITGMQVFVRVATAGGFSAAARTSRLSQTMVTKHVTALEERLGVKLLNRTTRRVTLTEAGRRYLASCERILGEIEEADREASADRLEPRGTLRLNVPLSFGLREMAPCLVEFQARYPAVPVDLGLTDRTIDLVDEGWDMAVRIGRLKDSSLVARRLAPCRMVVCAAPAYLERHGTPRTLEDLQAHQCLLYTLPTESAAERWGFGPTGDVMVPVRGPLRASNGDALCLAAVAGQGIVYQPTFMAAEYLRDGRLTAIRLDHPARQDSAVHAVLPPGRNPPAKTRAFVDFLARRLAPEPPWDRDLPEPALG